MTMIGALARLAHSLPSHRSLRRGFRLLAGALARAGADPDVVLRLKDGTKLALDSRSRTEAGVCWSGEPEPEVALLAALLRPDSIVVDVGANVGLIAIPLARKLNRARGGRLVAIEPVPDNLRRLRRSVELNALSEVVTVCPVALSNRTGVAELEVEGVAGGSGNAMITVPGRSAIRGGRTVAASTVALDELAGDIGLSALDLMKIDVEGFEVPALQGAMATVTKHRPIIYGEFNNQLMPARGFDFRDVWAMFDPMDYACVALDASGWPDVLAVPEPERGNVALVPHERLEFVTTQWRGVADRAQRSFR